MEFMSFFQLLPELIFDACQAQGYLPTGVLYPLNSYENRVYEIHLEENEPIVAKFYRPGRWSLEALHDEHEFVRALKEAEVPVVAPLKLNQPVDNQYETIGQISSQEGGSIYYAFYPKFRGRENPDLSNEERKWMGRSLARIHNVGEFFKAEHRLQLTPKTYGWDSLQFILTQEFLPSDLLGTIEDTLNTVLKIIEPYFKLPFKNIAVHGDCHPGNVLWNHDGPTLLDFDDMVIAPPIQDIWMLFYGDEEEKKPQRDAFFEGYETFRSFDTSSFILQEPLRTLRMIHHAAWIGKRYEEPAFHRAFPYYDQRRYWEEFLLSLKEQWSLLQELGSSSY